MSLILSEVLSEAQIVELVKIRKSYLMSARPVAEFHERYHRELQLADRSIYLVYECGTAVAYVQLLYRGADGDAADLANGHEIAHVHDLRVRADLQGQGIGRKVMLSLESEAQRQGVNILTLGVDDTNLRALSLYRSLGYTLLREVPGRTEMEKCLYLRKKIDEITTVEDFRTLLE